MPPNILLILTDQHSPHIAGYAGNRHIGTPTLDWLSVWGARFDAATCQSPLCVPSRMSMLTGKYPHHCDAYDNQSVLDSGQHITIPAWLARHGYETAAVGKMHFRGAEQMHGFQHRPYGDLVDSPISRHQPDPLETVGGRNNNHAIGRFPFAGPSQIPESLHTDTCVTAESLSWVLNFISTHSKRPWFLCASYYRPHFPLTAPARYIQMYLAQNLELPPLPKGYPESLHPHDRFIVDDFNLTRFSVDERRRALAAYYAALDYVEDRIGELLAALRREGALDNTYVIYTSDHGEMAGEHGLWWKRTYYEASAGVPLLVSGPGIAIETQIAGPVELVDLFPTFCEWAGIETPPDLDGESLVPLLTSHPEQRRKRAALSELLGETGPTRFRMARDARWKYVDFPDAPPRLFDLQSDPGETRDLIDAPPPDAPLDELRAHLSQSGTWDEIAARRAAIYREREPFELFSASSAHYRLPDGRIIEADDHLYDGHSVK